MAPLPARQPIGRYRWRILPWRDGPTAPEVDACGGGAMETKFVLDTARLRRSQVDFYRRNLGHDEYDPADLSSITWPAPLERRCAVPAGLHNRR